MNARPPATSEAAVLARGPVAIGVAPNGARKGKANHPALQMLPDELALCAQACAAEGATWLHLHVRDANGQHSLDPGHYREAIAAVRSRVGPSMLLQITTESGGRFGPEVQMAVVDALAPEAASVAVRELFVLGNYVERRPGHPRELAPLLAALPAGWPWTVCAFGPAEAACVTAAALAGGHVRVGFENNLHEPDGRVAPDNAALVRQAVNRIRACGLVFADVHEARRLLGMQPVASPIIPVVGTLAS